MKNIEVSDEVYAALQNLAAGDNRTPNDVLASLLKVSSVSSDASDPLAAFIVSPEFRADFTEDEKYLALLSWIAGHHATEFGEFIRAQTGSRRFLSMTRDEILDTCRHNQARQIDGTQYWAVMNIDSATRRRFLARVLEFIGYRELLIEFACGAIGGRAAPRRGLALVA